MDEAAAASAPPAMDRIYRRQRHIYDITRRYFLLGRDDLLRSLAVPDGGTALEIGCGTGRNLIAAARLYPGARLYGLDISSLMLRTAETSLRRAGLQDRIALREGDARAFDAATLFGRAHFDRVFFSYSISMIPPWREALAQGFDLVAPGGRMLVVDFGGQEDLPQWFRGGLRRWLTRFHVEPRATLHNALHETAAGEGAVMFRRLYRDYAWLGEICR
jgi:S-adenosylmethionine-diacylgycerolhomoserine-N-methlytransferase